jgi:uncharacterized damage-inducible protein DinB
MSKPSTNSYASYFQQYIDQVPETDLNTAFKNQAAGLNDFLHTITEEKSAYAYAQGKWTIKELLQHIIDAERIFAYRALCFARGEKTSLPSFDENEYAANSNAAGRTWKSLVEEFLAVRKATEFLFESLSEEALNNPGLANNNTTTAASVGFITLGHYYHHKKILEERYL